MVDRFHALGSIGLARDPGSAVWPPTIREHIGADKLVKAADS